MKVTIAQIDPVIGDIDGNLKKIVDVFCDHAKRTDLVVFPELSVTGYPPRDLLEKPGFIEKAQEALRELEQISGKYPTSGMIVGSPVPTGKKTGKGLYNSAVLIHGGKVLGSSSKTLLPAYDVFDETRYFEPAPEPAVIPFKGEMLGISVCEDMWTADELWPRMVYGCDPIEKLKENGATILINVSASPFYAGKEKIRYDLIKSHAIKHGKPFIFVNQVGGNDELVFDGRSLSVDAQGEPLAVLSPFTEQIKTVDTSGRASEGSYSPQDEIESVYQALVLGLTDYMSKCGFREAVIGLSGGIDSAVVSCIAADAIGPENVLGITMPSEYTSEETENYSKQLASNLGISFRVIPINDIYTSYLKALKNDIEPEDETDLGITFQNIQARVRGNILMAFSNRYGHLLLSTGNKSELAVGYCTLYGDMAGGLALISDVPKTMIYKMAGYINRKKKLIPQEIIDRPPSAELKPGQLDQDTLPPYDKLDEVLYRYLDEGESPRKLISSGLDGKLVNWVVRSVSRNEYKRRQAPPGIKVTSKAFGSGRRMPIAARYTE
ncbi:MAG: NAD+ synthase [Candidatus Omnitrophica bacterium]|nr:NAD+ synthase [Candidatus Omnitrophota bacterium]